MTRLRYTGYRKTLFFVGFVKALAIYWIRIAKKRFGMEDCYEIMQYRKRK